MKSLLTWKSFCLLVWLLQSGSKIFLLNLKLYDSSNALPCMHQFKGFINLVKRQIVSHKFINFYLFRHIFGHQLWDTFYTLPSSKGSAFPCAACYQLERASGDFLPCSSYADHHADTPALVTGLQGGSLWAEGTSHTSQRLYSRTRGLQKALLKAAELLRLMCI